ncbi:GlxA family transcriptional regulator [Teredinibacter turnerae]|uniref:GlxA family transcriptional regulator n=1 Tax=Teredinibacter turnerae TaxID=2426 RepID=UPI0030D16F29
MLQICFLLYPNMLATSTTLPMELLASATALAKTQHPRKREHIEITLASLDGKAVVTHTGITLTPDCPLDAVPPPDIVYLPALWRNPEPVIAKQRELLPWLQREQQRGAALAAVGTGCWFLAEAGLLDGKAATTHWYYFDRFQARYPKVQLKRSNFITQADNIFCAGSVNSLADLTVYFIQQHFGQSVAHHVERHFFHEIRRLYETAHAGDQIAKMHPDEVIVQAVHWLSENYHTDVNVSELAARFDMSVRTFNRRFKLATDTTPLSYLQDLRIKNAQELLKSTNLNLSEIMFRVGYQDIAHFTRLFKRILGLTPTQYRVTVRAKLFSAD